MEIWTLNLAYISIYLWIFNHKTVPRICSLLNKFHVACTLKPCKTGKQLNNLLVMVDLSNRRKTEDSMRAVTSTKASSPLFIIIIVENVKKMCLHLELLTICIVINTCLHTCSRFLYQYNIYWKILWFHSWIA